MNVGALIDIEQIKQVKARYFRFVDTKQWAELADLFTEDCEVRYGETEQDTWITGRVALIKLLQRAIGDGVTVHHGHMPEVTLHSQTTASLVIAMFDYVESAGDRPIRLRGYGHYHESYIKSDDGQWRIRRLQLTRLRVDPL